MKLEHVIFTNLIFNQEFAKKVTTFLKLDYFYDSSDRALFEIISAFYQKYGVSPTLKAVRIELAAAAINETTFKEAVEIVDSLKDEKVDFQWLLDQTETFCQDKAIYNGIKKSIGILDGDKFTEGKGAIPGILTEALGVSFDTRIGHDFIEDAPERFDYYRSNVARVPFDLDFFNKITGGGTPRKTLNVLMGGVHVGKSLFLCHMAAANLFAGLNVLYITLELAREEVARRIDANLLDIPISELGLVPREVLDKRIVKLEAKTKGKLIIEEYPTSCAGVGHFRHLLNELKTKRNFTVDVIYIDYLNICASSRLKYGATVNSYTLVKAIAEEVRGLAVEYNVPIWSATQTTREGFTSSDLGMENVAESFGLPATADFMAAIINGEELEKLNQLLVKQLKNRYTDAGLCRRFIIGVDRSKMRLYDVEQSAQEDVLDGPVMDRTSFGEQDSERSKKKFDFSSFK
jgi:archaellum biogenesis ATPase FlaH